MVLFPRTRRLGKLCHNMRGEKGIHHSRKLACSLVSLRGYVMLAIVLLGDVTGVLAPGEPSRWLGVTCDAVITLIDM